MAGRTAAYGRAAYQWALKRDSLASSPFTNLPLAGIASRERILTDHELAAIWKATEALGSFNAIVRMLILTGQRREEVAGMGWAELADDLSIWTIPAGRAKNGVAHVVPLSSQAQALLRGVPRHDGSGFIFPGRRGSFNGFGKAKEELDAASAVTNWHLHDLRRTMATGLQKLGVRLEVTEAVLNHIAGSRAGIVGVYQRHDYAAEKHAALAAWGEYVMALVERRTSESNLLRLPRRA
jgi:integrase